METCNTLYDIIPNEIYSNIYFQLPLYDRGVVFPLVCKRWYQFASEVGDRRKCLNTLIENINVKYKRLDLGLDYNKEQKMMLLKIIFNNNIISELKVVKLRFSKFLLEPTVRGSLCKGNKLLSLVGTKSVSTYISNFFNVVWDPKKLKIEINKKGENGDVRSSYRIGIDKKVFSIPNNFSWLNFDLNVNIHTALGLDIKKRTKFTWKMLKLEPYFEDMIFIIGDALKFELKNHIERLTEANIQKFSRITNIEDIKSKLICRCDKYGLIEQIGQVGDVSLPKADINSFILSVHKHIDPRIFSKEFQILHWDGPSLQLIDKVRCWKFSQVMQWCVLSQTIQKLSKKLGVLGGVFTFN